jgi:UDP-N-acetylglucosamine 1-carboxyvinyltransferase
MEVVHITGGNPLRGTVTISGSKNSCLPILAACLLTDEACTIENVPNLSDVKFMFQLLTHMGATVEQLSESTWRITAKTITHQAPYELVRKMRASVCLIGPLVGRLRRARVSLPGGCIIGQRPIDLHLKGLAAMGCDVKIQQGYVEIDAKHLTGSDIFLGGRYGSTVTGTANLLMTAVLTPGVTRIDSAACEPEVVDLCHLLVKMGAHIEGIGSHALTVHGVDKLKGCHHRLIGDRIEAGTFLIAGLMTNGCVTVKGVDANHLRALLHKLSESGAQVKVDASGSVSVEGAARQLKPIEIITLPYPGFPTDLQAQMCALSSMIPGLSIITERIYPNRYMHVAELQRMGAHISIEGASAIISGRAALSGAPVMASDLRASAALYLAGLVAEGETWVQRIYHVDRGYENFDAKLCSLGAQIQRMPASEMPKEMCGLED